MESQTISESIINGAKVSFFCIRGTPVGDVFIVSSPSENKFYENHDEAKAMYIKKAKALLS